jgi:diaminopimelate dehydrogenase
MNKEHTHVIEYSLKLDSNPEFTTSVLVAYARAALRMKANDGKTGCFTVLDVPPAYLSTLSDDDLRAHCL